MRLQDRRSVLVASAVFAGALGVGALAVRHLDRLEAAERRAAGEALARASAFAIEQRFASALAAASTLGEMVSAGASEAQLEAVARRQLELAGPALNLQLARDGIISHLWPEAGNEVARGLDLLRSPIHGPFVRRQIETRAPLLYGPFELVQGGSGFALRVPVFAAGADGRFWGLSSAIVRATDLLRDSRVPRLAEAGLEYLITRDPGTGGAPEVVATSRPGGLSPRDAVAVRVELPGQRWTLAVVPRGAWSEGGTFGAVAALLIALLAAVLAYRVQALPALLRREVAARTRELEIAHAEQRRAEEAQRQSQKLESIGLLAGGVAHDFNNLLVGILGYADLVAAEAAPGSTQREAADTIAQAARRAAELTRQLLALARLGQHREERVDLRALVEEAVKLLGRTLDKSIRLDARLGAEEHAVQGDPGQLQQVILNLAVNARDAMPEGGTLALETGTVAAGAGAVPGLRPGRYVTLTVADTGVGIPPEHLARLFDPFFTTKPPGKGSGLGLATAFGIVKGHGGTIRVESAPGAGSRFVVYLPEPAGAAGAEALGEEAAPRGSGVVLVVDDEELVRRTASRLLSSLGYEPVAVPGGGEAIAFLEGASSPPAAVLLDLSMPGMDGRAAFRAMRARHPGLRVVVTSGFSETGRAQELVGEGAVGFLQKPYRAAELARVIASAIQVPDRAAG